MPEIYVNKDVLRQSQNDNLGLFGVELCASPIHMLKPYLPVIWNVTKFGN
jgi:hypothetical protein